MALIELFTIVLTFSNIFSVSCEEINQSKVISEIDELIKHVISQAVNVDDSFASNITRKSQVFNVLAKFWDGISQGFRNMYQKTVNQYAKDVKCDLQDISMIIAQFIEDILKSIAITRNCISHPNDINNLLIDMYAYSYKNTTLENYSELNIAV